MLVCSFPVQATLPTHARPITDKRRRDESARYSYVAVARGPRPGLSASGDATKTKVGILDALRAGSKKQAPEVIELEDDRVQELSLGGDSELPALLPGILAQEARRTGADEATIQDALSKAESIWRDSAALAEDAVVETETNEAAEALELSTDFVSASTQTQPKEFAAGEITSLLGRAQSAEDDDVEILLEDYSAEDESAMRLEAGGWPRLVRPPLKKGGHVTFDACMQSGECASPRSSFPG